MQMPFNFNIYLHYILQLKKIHEVVEFLYDFW